MKLNITSEEIMEINKVFKGTIRNDAEVETSIYRCEGRNIITQVALMWRAILVGHPYSDGNKRTAFVVTMKLLKDTKTSVNRNIIEVMLNQMTKVAKENIDELSKIERMVRYAIEGR
ncbi:MAG: Fic family protein [Candidatus Aenigmarchaeota archaeon]|nr:Fic family protein [Candidatus Aenigmarchaeota archaeon]